MLAGDRAGDGEAETDGLGVARALDAIERLENLLAFAARSAAPAILDGEDDKSALSFQGASAPPPYLTALSIKLEIARRKPSAVFSRQILGTEVCFRSHPASRQPLLGLVAGGFGIAIGTESEAATRFPGVIFRPVDEQDANSDDVARSFRGHVACLGRPAGGRVLTSIGSAVNPCWLLVVASGASCRR